MVAPNQAVRPLLIVDLSQRALSALVVTPEGEVLPASPEVRNVATRVLSVDILYDPRRLHDPDLDWEEALEALSRSTPRNLFERARRIGLIRPWDRRSHDDLLRLASPLAVLSTPEARLDLELRPVLSAVAVALLGALLDPLFSSLAQLRLTLRQAEALMILPAEFGRGARLALHRVCRRRGLRRLFFLSRELAAAMARVESPGEYQVWDVAGDDLRLHHVTVETDEADEARRRLRTVATRTVQGLGWPHWVREVAAALHLKGLLAAVPTPTVLAALDGALASLLGGMPGTLDLPTQPVLRLNHGVLEEALGGGWSAAQVAVLAPAVAPALAALVPAGAPPTQLCGLGTACGLTAVEQTLAALAGGTFVPLAAGAPAPERLVRGVATGVLWRRAHPARCIEAVAGGSLRLDSLSGEACEILPASHLPRPGAACSLRRRFVISGASGEKAPSLLVHLLWGADAAPDGNSSLCALSLGPVAASAAPERALWLALHLSRSASGRQLRTTFEACLDGVDAPVSRGFFATHLAAIPSAAGGPMETGT